MNRIFVIGVVTRPPAGNGDAITFEVGVPQRHGEQEWLQRIGVVARGRLAERSRDLVTAQEVFADGRLTVVVGLPVVEAITIFPLDDAPPGTANKPGAGTHASPAPHERRGHVRRLHVGTPAERVTWVRSTLVGRERAGGTSADDCRRSGPNTAHAVTRDRSS